MLNIGLIGAGSISKYHLKAYAANEDCRVAAIADLNLGLAEERAKEFNIPTVVADYQEILADPHIDAVSIVTPTFTHKRIVIDALRAGKHVLCEKPPAMNAAETRECVEAAREAGKLLMFALVCRFRPQMQYAKKFISDGKMGRILTADAARLIRCDAAEGWMLSRAKGGGPLRDAVIHELDAMLWLMGYPKPRIALGMTSDVGKDLPKKLGGEKKGWKTADLDYGNVRDVENVATGYVLFENGASMQVKVSTILHTVSKGVYIELSGENAGIRMEPGSADKKLVILDRDEAECFRESSPELPATDNFNSEITHFIDCCLGKTECLCRPEEAVALMEIIDAIYLSADTGKPVIF